MAGTGAGYDLSVTTFSPDGRVFQVEYANKAVELSGTTVAICCSDGILWGVEKFLVSKMLVPGTNKRLYPIHRHAGGACAGLVADGRQIVSRARQEANSYYSAYREEIPPAILAERLGMFVHAYTLYWSIRPFGSSMLMGTVEPESHQPAIFCIEPSGLVHKYRGHAIGKGAQAAKTEIEKLLAAQEGKPEFTCEKALAEVARILHKVHDEKDRDFEFEAAWICPASNWQHAMVPPNLLKAAEAEAKARIEAEDEDE
eukprot:gnl/TRDRNA2_/TRDRNA2_180093_c0_seq1.p1 gnl/TRDRNA2_/TRDRNA2_180093_c0~~gnl/TRDRNA2_/TRDRNA2_180093_c0_seq1.p1  ORF type:complete len:257 (+),score=57.90 gnl/TRDRNA2_/TRDRNA2_180093_c0_seq1:47-817(+)